MPEASMLEQAAAFGAQLRAAAPLARGVLAGRGPFTSVLLCGLGGSAAGGRLATELLGPTLRLPVGVASAARLPGFVGPQTLVVATSYSGATAETLDWFAEARERGATRAALTAGGPLAAEAERAGDPLVQVESGYQPRGALGLLLAPLLVLLHEAGACGDPDGLIARGADAADAVMARCGPGTDGGRARADANRLAGRGTVLYGTGPRGAVAVRLKNQLNENAKACAFAGAIPEIAHNEVLGWIGVARGRLRLGAVLLRDAAETAGERAIVDGIATHLRGEAEPILEWRGEEADEVSRAFGLLAYGDCVSCYLAEAEGVDPVDIERLGDLKRRLAAARASA